MKTLKLFIAFTLILGLSYGCSKYDENDGLTLKTKKSRLCQTWKWQSYTTVTFDNDGTIRKVLTSPSGYGSITFVTNGEWEFQDNKNSLYYKFDGGDGANYEILKLERYELSLKKDGVVHTYSAIY